MTPLVTIVTTVYNGERYADRAIPSILGQTFRDFEYIVVDDGSTDGTAEMLCLFAAKDARVHILSPGRIGFAKALNYAIDHAKGDYIARQDIDDVSYPNRLKMQVDFLDAHPGVGVVGCHYVLSDTGRNEKYIRRPPTAHGDLVNELSKRIPISHTHAMFRKKAWEDAGRYQSLVDAEDLALWIEMVKKGWEMANIPEVLGEHAEHSQSFFHGSVNQWLRHREMARLQVKAVFELKLPLWMLVYPVGRLFYLYLPNSFKRFLRRSIGGSSEQDIAK